MSHPARLLAILLLAATPAATAHAQADRPEQPSPAERLQEGAAALIDGLRLLMDQLQSYQSPEVLPNGDIIIRRRPPVDTAPEPEGPDAPPSPDNKPRPL